MNAVESTKVDLEETIELNAGANVVQHEQTRTEIAELKEALR